jgi:uncharacterized protein (TIGR01777 family)
MRLFITGATGLVGRRLLLDRLERGDQVTVLSRDAAAAGRLFAADANPNVTVVEGDPARPGPWQKALDGCDAVIHLAGAPVAGKRWSKSYKERIWRSRVDSTHQVVEAMREAKRPPTTFVCASAIGWYGETGSTKTDERAPRAEGDFFGDLAGAWETEALRAETLGVRVVRLRIGLVLDVRGGVLKSLTRVFGMYVGGSIGSGRQYMSWIHWRDLVGLIHLALLDHRVKGPLNGVAPTPVSNREFVHLFGAVLGKPSWLPTPKFALRLALGEMGRYVAMSQRILPQKAIDAGYKFAFAEIGPALADLYRPKPAAAAVAVPATILAAARTAAEAHPPRSIRLLALSVEGTIARHTGPEARAVAIACREAQVAGCVVVLASSRSPKTIRPITEALNLVAPTINCNGALIWNPLDHRPLYHEALPADLGGEIIEVARGTSASVFLSIERLDRWFTDRIHPTLGAAPMNLPGPDGIGPLESFLTAPITRLSFAGTQTEIARVRRTLEERYWKQGRVTMFQPSPNLIQVSHPLVDKGIALQRIAGRMHAGRESVMAIGRDAGDLGMLEWAGLSVALASAPAEAKRLAQVTAEGADQAAIARSIRRFILHATPDAANS